MDNWGNDTAPEYHQVTKYWLDSPPASQRVEQAIIPRPYKLYRDLGPLSLPSPRPSPMPALDAIGGNGYSSARLDLTTLSTLLHFSAGIIRRRKFAGRTIDFRAAACTGALYHIELYVVSTGLADLDAGVYHYGVHDESLRRLRSGDYRRAIAAAAPDAEAFVRAEAVVVLTSTFWRNAWRYEDRAYRHAFWDSGTILANLLSLAAAHGLPATLSAGFVDPAVNALVGVDGVREAAVALVALGRSGREAPERLVESLDLAIVPLSPIEIEYPYITRLHEDSSLATRDDLRRWQGAEISMPPAAAGEKAISPPRSPGLAMNMTLEEVIAGRGSARRFSNRPIELWELGKVLECVFRPLEADFLATTPSLTQAFLIVNAIEGLAPGAYVYDRLTASFQLLRLGEFRDEASSLGLDDSLAGEAAVALYLLAPLGPILQALGTRGYRAAQLDGGIRGGRVYLAAYALGLNATGLTFYDDAVIDFFGAPAAAYDVMFLMLIGH